MSVPGVHQLREAGAVDLHGRDDRGRAGFGQRELRGPHFGEMHASMMAFKNDSLPWTQVAELSYDSFMARMRTRT